jgi:hypothetical protein
MSSVTELAILPRQSAVLDEAHVGHINGALGTIQHGDIAPRIGWVAKLRTLLAILGPGLIVMVGDNDAGAFGTYTQAGQDYGTTLLWTLALLVPVLYVNQEMVLRLGTVSGVGHARLILERFGKFWGAFSVIDLFLLNALTIVTEFIGINLALGYLGVSKELGVVAAALLIMVAAGTGSFRRFERFSLMLVVGSLLLVPVFLMVHPPVGAMAADFFCAEATGRKPVEQRDAADHRHRRHDGGAVAAVFSAELRHRQAHSAAFHPLRAGRFVDRHCLRNGRGRGLNGGRGGDVRGPS